ncbi:hypothetical protein [Nakamurella sp.]|uniref:hypothetical protein n=1 Tax=Nakamurella sp. TaxID=1869182 RepID=UPI0037842F48
MKAHHIAALIGCVGLSGIALTDAFVQATTGHDSIFAADDGPVGAIVASDVWHGLTYAALTWVLIAEAARFAAANRVARICRWVLVVCLAASAVSFVVIVPALLVTESTDGAFAAVFGALGTPIFFGTILAAVVLGLALIRTNPVGIGGRVLVLILPVTGIIIALAFLAPAYAHPGWVETVVNVGIALIGVGVAAPAVAGAAAEVSPSSSRP